VHEGSAVPRSGRRVVAEGSLTGGYRGGSTRTATKRRRCDLDSGVDHTLSVDQTSRVSKKFNQRLSPAVEK
jgi:hypothetical protein